jgi:hypothetical protein
MTTSKSGNGKRMTAKAKLTALQDENEKLKKTVEQLKSVNAEQLQRLVNAELLRDRINELERKLKRNTDE